MTEQLLLRARRIIEDGGDPDPCQLGVYCLRCCLATAKSELLPGQIDDELLIETRDLIARYDNGIEHTKESALALLDKVLAEVRGA